MADGSQVRGRPFQPGVSGNPAGRSKNSHDIRTLAKTKTKAAFEKIVKLMDSANEKIQLQACMALLAYAHGKPAVLDDENDKDKRTINLTINRFEQPAGPAPSRSGVTINRDFDDVDPVEEPRRLTS